MGATEKIAKWIIDTGYEDIPPDAIRVANESCFDLLGVILAGSTEPVGEIIRQYVADQGGTDEATVLATGQRSTSSQAALGQRHNGPRPGLRRLRRVRPSHGGNLPRPVGPGGEDGRNRTGPAGSLCRRLRGWLGPSARHQVQPDGEGISRHRRHRPHGLHVSLRQAAGAG